MEEGTFSEEEVHLLEAFANEAAIAIENSRLYTPRCAACRSNRPCSRR